MKFKREVTENTKTRTISKRMCKCQIPETQEQENNKEETAETASLKPTILSEAVIWLTKWFDCSR